ncbi:MAG: hypothetical protein QXM75_01600 [Candidatus Diapherotrites archaeon]
MKQKAEKGQLFTSDFIFALAVFGAALLMINSYSYFVSLRVKEFEAEQNREYVARRAAQTLMLSAGDPSDWYLVPDQNIKSLGIASEPNILQRAKIESLASKDYNLVKNILGIQNYDFNLTIFSSSGRVLYSVGKTKSKDYAVTKINRIGLLDGSAVFITLEVFE